MRTSIAQAVYELGSALLYLAMASFNKLSKLRMVSADMLYRSNSQCVQRLQNICEPCN